MAYFAGDATLTFRGAIGSGEEWSNTWCIKADGGTPDPDLVTGDFHTFYQALSTGVVPMLSVLETIDQVRYHDLFTNSDIPVSWVSITGAGTGALLPAECALRVSLRSLQRNGGPFLLPLRAASLDTNGQMLASYQAALVGYLNTLVTDLAGHSAQLALHSPTTSTALTLAGAKVGRTFDAIRRRRNDMPEAYLNVTL